MKTLRSSNIPFLDMTFNLFLSFVVLFILAITVTNESTPKHEGVELNTKVLITITWSGDSFNDVDIYVKDPNNTVVYYNHRDTPFISLDKDDRGVSENTDPLTGKILHQNDEVVSIRKIIPGKYIINVRMYDNRLHNVEPVKVHIVSLDPYKEILNTVVNLNQTGDEKTAARIYFDDNGNVLSMDNIFESIVPLNGATRP